MEKFDVNEYRKKLKKHDLALVGTPAKGSLIYMPNGVKIRENLYGVAIRFLKQMGFKQIILSDFIDAKSLEKIDSVSKLSHNYFHIEGTDLRMTAGHEISCYSLIREQLKDYSKEFKFPIKYFHFGAVYRAPKNTRFPFNYGERKSFLECYSIFKTRQEAYDALDEGVVWNRKIVKDILHLPGVEVERPRATNKRISHKSVHIDTITPLGETIITGMTYFHDDVFTKALNVKRHNNSDGKNYLVYSTHFGLSENVLHSYLINCYDGKGFKFHSFLAPTQISVIDTTNGLLSELSEYQKIYELLNEQGYDFEKIETSTKKVSKNVKNSLESGTPIVLILKKVEKSLKIVLVSCGAEVDTTLYELQEQIEKAFEENDRLVTERLEKKEADSIIACNTIEDIVQNVKDCKVAKFYCEKLDERAIEVEQYLQGGEVLGFQTSKDEGFDVITGERTHYIAFASRRS